MQRLFDEINGDGEERVMGKKGQFIKEQRSFRRELHLERPSSELQDNKSLPSTSSGRQREKNNNSRTIPIVYERLRY